MFRSHEAEESEGRLKTTSATIVFALMLVIYWLALFCGTHIDLTHSEQADLSGGSDKVVHFASYFGLAVLLLSLRATRGVFSWFSIFYRWFVIAGYGVFDELTQLLVQRDAEVYDWIADVIGAAIGLGFVNFVTWLYRKKRPDLPSQF